jgi:hypothetical protein
MADLKKKIKEIKDDLQNYIDNTVFPKIEEAVKSSNGSTGSTSTPEGKLLFKDYFNVGSLKGFKTSEISKNQRKILSGGVLRFTRNKGDKIHAGGYRAEIQRGRVSPKAKMWYGFDLMIDQSVKLPTDPKAWCHVAQWHAWPDFSLGEPWRRPPLALSIRGGRWHIEWSYDKKRVSTKTSMKIQREDMGPVKKGQWTRWVFHINWDYSGKDSLLQIWKNGNPIISSARSIGYNDAKGCYFKTGIYNDKDKFTPWVSYLRDVRIAGKDGNYELVS